MSYGRLLLGAISAFVAQCAIAVSVGNALKDLPHALFFLMGFYLLIEAFMPLVNRAIGF
jgi:hypothetical protein